MMVAPKRLQPAGRQAREEFRMHRCFKSRAIVGVVCAIGLTVTAAWAQTLAPPSLVKAKLERLRIAVAPRVQMVNDYQVIIHTTMSAPDLVDNLSANTDLVMESKARWDAGGKELYGKKVVGTGPFEFVERKLGVHVLYKRV